MKGSVQRKCIGGELPDGFLLIVFAMRWRGEPCLKAVAKQGVNLPLKAEFRSDPQLWDECIVGAVQEEDYLALLCAAGFENVTVIHEVDYFSKSADLDTRDVAARYGAKPVVILGGRAS